MSYFPVLVLMYTTCKIFNIVCIVCVTSLHCEKTYCASFSKKKTKYLSVPISCLEVLSYCELYHSLEVKGLYIGH